VVQIGARNMQNFSLLKKMIPRLSLNNNLCCNDCVILMCPIKLLTLFNADFVFNIAGLRLTFLLVSGQ